MKKILSLFILGLSFPGWGAELVSAVNFNPSRVGDYKQLVVSQEATFSAGLQTPELIVKSNGEVKLIRNTATDAYRFFAIGGGGISGEADNVTVDFPNALWYYGWPSSIGSDDRGYEIGGTYQPASGKLIPTLYIKSGGRINFTQDSYVSQISYDGSDENLHNAFYLYATTLKAKTLEVQGKSTGEDLLNSSGGPSNESIYGLRLKGATTLNIPYPNTANSRVFKMVNSSWTQQNNYSILFAEAACTLAWLPFQKSGGGTVVYILGFNNCNTQAPGGGGSENRD